MYIALLMSQYVNNSSHMYIALLMSQYLAKGQTLFYRILLTPAGRLKSLDFSKKPSGQPVAYEKNILFQNVLPILTYGFLTFSGSIEN